MNVQIHLGGIFDFAQKQEQLIEVQRELEQPDVWNDPDRAQELGRRKSRLEDVVGTLERLDQTLSDSEQLIELAAAEDDEATLAEIAARRPTTIAAPMPVSSASLPGRVIGQVKTSEPSKA